MGQSSGCGLGSVQHVFSWAYTRAVGTSSVWGSVCLSAALAHVCLWHVTLADLSARQVDPGVALVTFDHGASCERLHAETCHQVPRVII